MEYERKNQNDTHVSGIRIAWNIISSEYSEPWESPELLERITVLQSYNAIPRLISFEKITPENTHQLVLGKSFSRSGIFIAFEYLQNSINLKEIPENFSQLDIYDINIAKKLALLFKSLFESKLFHTDISLTNIVLDISENKFYFVDLTSLELVEKGHSYQKFIFEYCALLCSLYLGVNLIEIQGDFSYYEGNYKEEDFCFYMPKYAPKTFEFILASKDKAENVFERFVPSQFMSELGRSLLIELDKWNKIPKAIQDYIISGLKGEELNFETILNLSIEQ